MCTSEYEYVCNVCVCVCTCIIIIYMCVSMCGTCVNACMYILKAKVELEVIFFVLYVTHSAFTSIIYAKTVVVVHRPTKKKTHQQNTHAHTHTLK